LKIKRQSVILQLIKDYDIETQEDLANRLIDEGFLVTQATVSRDIRELKLTKVPTSNSKHKYAVLPEQEVNINEKYIKVFQNGFIKMERAGNIIVIKTLTGMAMAVAAAIDSMNFSEVVGSIAGDDTIFCAVRTEKSTLILMEKFDKISKTKNFESI
jgi:transcriptional regulator of arginine metabolism